MNHIYKTEIKNVESKIKILDKPLNMIEKSNRIQFMYGMLVEAAENNQSNVSVENVSKDQLPDVVEFFD